MKYVIQLFYDWHIPVIQNLSVGAVGRPVIAQHAGKITQSLDQMISRPQTSSTAWAPFRPLDLFNDYRRDLSDSVGAPLDLFNDYKRDLSDDYLVGYRHNSTVTEADCFTMAAIDIEDEVKRLGLELQQISAALYNSDYLKQERKQRAVGMLGDGAAASGTGEITEALNYNRQEKAAFVQERLLTGERTVSTYFVDQP